MVSPELTTSLTVASMPIAARYAFVNLWSYLDDEGRGKDNAVLLKAHLWPLDDGYTVRKVEADLLRWVEAGMVCRYTVESLSFLHCPKWTTWQSINHKTPVRIPPCPLELVGADHEHLGTDSRSPTGVLREDYLRAQGWLPHRVVEVSRDKSSSGDLDSTPTHTFATCPDPTNHIHHRVRAVS